MTDVLDPGEADEVYLAALEPRPRRSRRRWVLGVLDLWCSTTGGRMELTRAADVVVRRREDGIEELRVPVPVADDAPYWLGLVRGDLLELGPDEFRDRWGIA